jgi:hypothetical protein
LTVYAVIGCWAESTAVYGTGNADIIVYSVSIETALADIRTTTDITVGDRT